MTYDLAIIGGGPAGVSAGVYASRKRLKTVFITDHFEGQSAVSEGIENWIGEVNIKGADLVKKLRTHLLAYAEGIIDIKEGDRGESVVKKDDGTFEIKAGKNTYSARAVLICTGSHRRKLDVPGATEYENKGVVYCASCDGPLFAGQDVVVAGGGNAAFETVAQLLAYCKSVTLIHRGADFRADPVTVEKLSSNPKLSIIKNAVIKEIKGGKFVSSLVYTDAAGEDKELPVTGIFVEIGLIPNTEFLKGTVEINPYGQIVVDPRTQMSKTPGIWAAGDCTDGLYHQNNIAAGEGVKALEDIYIHLHTK